MIYKGYTIKKVPNYEITNGGYVYSNGSTLAQAKRMAQGLAGKHDLPMRVSKKALYHIYGPSGSYKSTASSLTAAKQIVNNAAK